MTPLAAGGGRSHSYPHTGLMLLSAVVKKLGKAQRREKVAADQGGVKGKKKCPDAYELTNVCFGC